MAASLPKALQQRKDASAAFLRHSRNGTGWRAEEPYESRFNGLHAVNEGQWEANVEPAASVGKCTGVESFRATRLPETTTCFADRHSGRFLTKETEVFEDSRA
jgi:hypothetical protein